MSNIASAIAAYQAAAKGSIASPAVETPEVAPGQGFADLVKSVATQAIEAQHQSEELGKAAIAGKADVRDVVAAVANAELTLETVVAVRDKVINAYNEILRMPI